MSLVQEHMHTLKTFPISLCRQTCFETNFLPYIGPRICSCLFFNCHFRFVFLFNLHYTNLLTIMTKAHNIFSKVYNTNAIEQFLAHSLIVRCRNFMLTLVNRRFQSSLVVTLFISLPDLSVVFFLSFACLFLLCVWCFFHLLLLLPFWRIKMYI